MGEENFVILEGKKYFVNTLYSKDISYEKDIHGTFLDLRGLHISRITDIEGLNELSELKMLDLSSNDITKIEGLDKLTDLKRLDLNSNCITKIDGLGNLRNLTMLDLSNNKISKIQGLKSLSNLDFLDLHDNVITKIENIQSLWFLKTLFLHNNLITSVPKIGCFGKTGAYGQIVYFSNNPLVDITELRNFGNVLIYVEADPKYEALPDFVRYTASEHAIIRPRPN